MVAEKKGLSQESFFKGLLALRRILNASLFHYLERFELTQNIPSVF